MTNWIVKLFVSLVRGNGEIIFYRITLYNEISNENVQLEGAKTCIFSSCRLVAYSARWPIAVVFDRIIIFIFDFLLWNIKIKFAQRNLFPFDLFPFVILRSKVSTKPFHVQWFYYYKDEETRNFPRFHSKVPHLKIYWVCSSGFYDSCFNKTESPNWNDTSAWWRWSRMETIYNHSETLCVLRFLLGQN